MTRTKPTLAGLPADRALEGDFRRILTAGRQVLRVPTLDADGAVDLARELAGRFAGLDSGAVLADRRELISLFEDLNGLGERLEAERAVVGEKLSARARHGRAGRAYRQGGVR